MILPPFSRRRLLVAAALLAPVIRSCPAWGLSPFLAAIQRAEAADAEFLVSGLITRQAAVFGAPLPSDWSAHRAMQRQARSEARVTLYALTPATPHEAEALVSYLTERAARCGVPGAAKAARRRLRGTFARPGACRPP